MSPGSYIAAPPKGLFTILSEVSRRINILALTSPAPDPGGNDFDNAL